jgi:hypothetical protein
VPSPDKLFFEKVFTAPNTVIIDELQKHRKPGTIIEVAGQMNLRDDTEEIRLYNIANPHAEGMLIGYMARSDLLWVTDMYSPARDGPKSPGGVNLYDTLQHLGIKPSRLAGGHGASASFAEFERGNTGGRVVAQNRIYQNRDVRGENGKSRSRQTRARFISGLRGLNTKRLGASPLVRTSCRWEFKRENRPAKIAEVSILPSMPPREAAAGRGLFQGRHCPCTAPSLQLPNRANDRRGLREAAGSLELLRQVSSKQGRLPPGRAIASQAP